MLHRQILFKQLQEMQRQQQLQELNQARQHSFVNQLPSTSKQISADLHPSLINGMYVHDTSQMFMVGDMDLMQHGTSPIMRGFPNGSVISQAQGQPIGSNGVLPELFDAPLHGTPIGGPEDNMNPYLQIQGASHCSVSMFNRGSFSQLEIPEMQSSTVSNSFWNEPQFNASPPKVCFSGMNKTGTRQEEACWLLPSAGVTSTTVTSLDPLEERILFNTDDNIWESALGRQSNVGLASFDSNREHADLKGTSNQSGSWSALMQSAVAETSSSDTGQQEEWSGLTFQNLELSPDEQHASYIGDGKQSSWMDNNLQSILSPTSRPDISFQKQSGILVRPKEGTQSDSSHDSVQQSPENAGKWFERNLQSVEGRQAVQVAPPLQNVWHNQKTEASKTHTHQPSVSCSMIGQSDTNVIGNELNENVWLHESGPQPMGFGSQRLPDQVPLAWSNQEEGYVGNLKYADNVANVGMSSEKVFSAGFETNSRTSGGLPPGNKADSLKSSAHFSGQRMIYNPSGNRLHQLNKADKSVEIRSGIHLCSRDSVPSQSPQTGNCNLFYNSSVPQGFSLRLTPPSEHLPNSSSSFGSPSKASSSVINASGPLHLNRQLQNQYHLATPVTSQMPLVAGPPFTGLLQASVATCGASDLIQTIIQGRELPRLKSLPVTQLTSTSCMPQQIGHSLRLPNTSQNALCQTNVLQAETTNVFSILLPPLDSTNSNSSASSSARQDRDSKEDQMDQLNRSGVYTKHDTLNHGQEAVVKHLSGANATTSISMNSTTHQQAFDRVERMDNNTPNVSGNNDDVFVRSLRPHGLRKDLALLHKVNGIATQQLFQGLKSGVSNLAVNDPNSYSHFKKGQMLSVHDLMLSKEATKQFSIGQVNTSILPSSILPNSATKIIPAKRLPPPFYMPLERNLGVSATKKRKLAAFDLPWRKQITHVSEQLQKVSSMVESKWASASNRLSEKVEDEIAMVDDLLPISQAKKRLLLTTQLVQQVFRPAPALLLSADAISNCETMIYFVARLALGDTCSMTSIFKRPLLTTDESPKNLRTSEEVGELEFSEAAQEFICQAKSLGDELLRLDRTLSIVDMKVDSQELENLSIVNQLVKFHSRGRSVLVNAGSDPGVQKMSPQRYVVAHTMPKVVPEGFNCISL